MFASIMISRFLEGCPEDEIHRAAHHFLGLAGHFQKLSRQDG